MKTSFAIMIAVAVTALGCDDPDVVGDLEENKEILELGALEEEGEPIMCGSKVGVVGGYSTKCSCDDYTLACVATQTVHSPVCQKAGIGCTYIQQRSGTWQTPTFFKPSTGWTGTYWGCAPDPGC